MKMNVINILSDNTIIYKIYVHVINNLSDNTIEKSRNKNKIFDNINRNICCLM